MCTKTIVYAKTGKKGAFLVLLKTPILLIFDIIFNTGTMSVGENKALDTFAKQSKMRAL